MSPSLRRIGSRKLSYSTDSDCKIVEVLKLQLHQSEHSQTILHSTSKNDTLLQGSFGSGTQGNGKQKGDRRGTSMNGNCNIKSKDKPSRPGNTCEYNKSDACPTRNWKNNRKKCIENKGNSAKCRLPSHHANDRFLRSSKSQKVDKNRNAKASIKTLNRKCALKEKEKPVTDLTSEIIRITEDIHLIFSKFISHVLQLHLNYFQDARLDPGHMISVYKCIICKLKDKLTEKQLDLTNSYDDWNKKHNYCSCPKMQSQQWSESSTDSETPSATAYKKRAKQRTRKKKKVLKDNRNTMVIEQCIMNNTGGSSSETTDRFLSSSDKVRRRILRRNKDACINLDNLPEVSLIKLPLKSSTPICETELNSISNRETPVRNSVRTSGGQVEKVHESPSPKAPEERITEYISDDSSLATTIEMVETYGSASEISANASLTATVNVVKREVLGVSDSVHNKIESMARDIQDPCKYPFTSATETYAYPPDGKNVASEQHSNVNFPDRDSLNIKDRVERLYDSDCKFYDTSQKCSIKVECSNSSTQDLQGPSEYACKSETDACPPDDKNFVSEQHSNFNFPDRDSLNIKDRVKKLHDSDCKFYDTNQKCSIKVEFSNSSTQDLQGPSEYACKSETDANAPDDKNFVSGQHSNFCYANGDNLNEKGSMAYLKQ